jgi:hypothetical protein
LAPSPDERIRVPTPDDLPPDATPPDTLGPARPLIAAALALGPAMLAAGDARGAHEVYDCAARLILAALPVAAPLHAATVAALEAAEFEPDPTVRADTLQTLFLDAAGDPFAEPDDATDDPDEGGPLDRAHGAIGQAISLGAPAFNLGNHRGCCEVYAATVRLIAAAAAAPAPVRERLDRALAETAAVADERKKAWVLRDALDDVLTLSAGRAKPRITARDVRVLISMAVQIGAPAYNLGDHRGCYEVYATTARLILQVAPDAEREREVIRAALQTAAIVTDATEQAWVLRRAFDAILSNTE